MRQKLLACIAVLGVASSWAGPMDTGKGGPITVYGVVDMVINDQLKTFRDNYQSELEKQLMIEPNLADRLIRNLGFDEYRNRLNHMSVKQLLDHPVIVLMRSNPKDPHHLSIYMVKGGIANMMENPLSMPIHDALRSGENVPIVFSPALLPAANILKGLHLDQSVTIVSKTLTIPNFARLAISFSDIPWLLVQPKHMVVDMHERGLKEIGTIEVVGKGIALVKDLAVAEVSDLRTTGPMSMKTTVPLRSGLGTMRDGASFLNWPSLNLPAISDIPAIVLNFPLNIVQSLLDYIRERPPVSVKPIVRIPSVKPVEPQPDPVDAAKMKEPVVIPMSEEKPKHIEMTMPEITSVDGGKPPVSL